MKFWLDNFYKNVLETSCSKYSESIPLEDGMKLVSDELLALREKGGSLWWVGNGGSAAVCSHLSQDVLGKLKIKSIALTDAALLTCGANDFGYENVYVHPLNILMTEGDLIIAISSGGNSQNILNACELAKARNVKIISLSGFSDQNKLKNLDHFLHFHLNSDSYGHVEVGHELLLHCIIENSSKSVSLECE